MKMRVQGPRLHAVQTARNVGEKVLGVFVFKRVLIANRGEIAIRIGGPPSGLGVETVSVYAPAECAGLHVRATTSAHALAASANPVAAYLDVDALVARRRRAAATP